MRRVIQGWAHSPALHFAVLGLVLFLGTQHQRPATEEVARRALVIPAARLELALRDFESSHRRPPTAAEQEELLRHEVDQEILFQYALDLGLAQEEVAQRRLAQVAAFVTDAPAETSTADQAAAALALGLHQGDRVARRILVDGARRVIREPILLREPTEEALLAFLEEHREEFLRPQELRITQVTVSHARHREHTEEVAKELLARLRHEAVAPADADLFGERSMVVPHLPRLSRRELERRLGHRFVRQLDGLAAGSWQGPVSSHFGSHLVFIHERLEPRGATLEEMRSEVRGLVRQRLADQWLAFRLQQLRLRYVVPDVEFPTNLESSLS